MAIYRSACCQASSPRSDRFTPTCGGCPRPSPSRRQRPVIGAPTGFARVAATSNQVHRENRAQKIDTRREGGNGRVIFELTGLRSTPLIGFAECPQATEFGLNREERGRTKSGVTRSPGSGLTRNVVFNVGQSLSAPPTATCSWHFGTAQREIWSRVSAADNARSGGTASPCFAVPGLNFGRSVGERNQQLWVVTPPAAPAPHAAPLAPG